MCRASSEARESAPAGWPHEVTQEIYQARIAPKVGVRGYSLGLTLSARDERRRQFFVAVPGSGLVRQDDPPGPDLHHPDRRLDRTGGLARDAHRQLPRRTA